MADQHGRRVRRTPVRLTHEEALALPMSIPLWPTAGQAWGLSRSQTYELAKRDALPFRVVRLGQRLRVTRADLLRSLGEHPDSASGDAA